jgi:hypothetical protein
VRGNDLSFYSLQMPTSHLLIFSHGCSAAEGGRPSEGRRISVDQLIRTRRRSFQADLVHRAALAAMYVL